MTFGELIDGIGKSLGVELVDEGGATAVQVDGNAVILQAAGDDLLLIRADLGEIAPVNRARVLDAAMEANFLYKGTGGATLAVDSRNGHLHIHKYNWLERLNADAAIDAVGRLAEVAAAWRRMLSDSACTGPSGGGDGGQLGDGGFLQV